MKKSISPAIGRLGTVYATIAIATLAVSPVSAKNLFAFGSKETADQAKAEANVKVNSEKRAGNRTWVTGSTIIHAAPNIVWETVHEERKRDPDLAYSKVLEQGKNECRLEQKFVLIPVLGTAVCEMHNSEVPLKRIDYKLLKSDRFKAMEGSWVLTPSEDGRSTTLELSTHIDLGMPVPEQLTTNATKKKLARRLANVKKMAEKTHAQLAEKGPSSAH
ncbi:MAG: hypothetical protein K2Z81_23105 [Cyanobacteria bacterium]|nr:hypothetical protein [Cyanobacteriota bacterium]